MKKLLSASFVALVVAGCASEIPKNMPLIFGESITVGIGIGASPADGGGDFTFGVKTKDVAVIPVVVYDKVGNPLPIRAENDEKSGAEKSVQGPKDNQTTMTEPSKDNKSKDAFSVIGVFSTDTSAQSKTVGMGKFFATGTAAQRLADGFAKCLATNGCTGAAKPAEAGK